MVKGNRDRRKALGMRRKEDKLAESSRKRLGGAMMATPAEARARLLSDTRCGGRDSTSGGMGEEALRAWATKPEGGKDVCEHWWRSGQCPLRRCKYAHQDSIAHLSGVPDVDETGGGDDGSRISSVSSAGTTTSPRGVLPALVEMPLRAVKAGGKLQYDRNLRTHVRQDSTLLFVAMGQELVFDAFNPGVFAAYVAKRANAAKSLLGESAEQSQQDSEGEAKS